MEEKKKARVRDLVKGGLRIAGGIGSGLLTGFAIGAVMAANPAAAGINALSRVCVKVAHFGIGSAIAGTVAKETDNAVDAVCEVIDKAKIVDEADKEAAVDIEIEV